ncbi:hypothetical protein [Chelatococcus composti]|jgi:predicted small secreted protein|uniref:Putative small secreted protein n=1 Tax=Chelatococcus composti TaxID=1743235 RepID=A0A841KA82_9HYPH|nr:hypothetical protein [Chelatococcus composti]MBB6169778.1 putative small secreted protein [Chelatococcus composti]MBS7736251.1 hypothetical protein [Chelatococcus composti]PZN46326.1 MAG: hypothetical protein DIU59_00030 [Pseudomonadota bacterium]GGG49888.1 hypothetical protein GCM10008026_33930 [Chelatococcus composti]
MPRFVVALAAAGFALTLAACNTSRSGPGGDIPSGTPKYVEDQLIQSPLPRDDRFGGDVLGGGRGY